MEDKYLGAELSPPHLILPHRAVNESVLVPLGRMILLVGNEPGG